MIIPSYDLAWQFRNDSNGGLAAILNLECFTLRDLFLDLRPVSLHFAYRYYFHYEYEYRKFYVS